MSGTSKLIRNSIIAVIGSIFALIAGTAVMAFAVQFLWNKIVPQLFDMTTITYVQSLGLLLLCSFLFKGVDPLKTATSKKNTPCGEK